MIGTIEVSRNENYSRGVALYDQGLYTESIAEFERVLETIPEEDAPERRFASFYMCEAYANLSLAHLRMNMYRRAEEELKQALVIHPEYADLHFSLAVTYYKQGHYTTAEEHFTKALQINPKYARAMLYLGMTKLRQGCESGIETMSEAVSLEPAYHGDEYKQAMKLYRTGDLDECLRLIEEIAETDVDHISLLLESGLKLMAAKMYREAALEFLEAVSFCPHYADVRHYLGLCYLQQGMVDLAVGQFRKALTVNPDFVAARVSLALAYAESGRHDLAIQEGESVLKSDPDNAEVQQMLSKLGEVR